MVKVDFKIGDFVKCIDPHIYPDALEMGGVYKILSVDNHNSHINIRTHNGKYIVATMFRFITMTEYREKIINEILDNV